MASSNTSPLKEDRSCAGDDDTDSVRRASLNAVSTEGPCEESSGSKSVQKTRPELLVAAARARSESYEAQERSTSSGAQYPLMTPTLLDRLAYVSRGRFARTARPSRMVRRSWAPGLEEEEQKDPLTSQQTPPTPKLSGPRKSITPKTFVSPTPSELGLEDLEVQTDELVPPSEFLSAAITSAVEEVGRGGTIESLRVAVEKDLDLGQVDAQKFHELVKAEMERQSSTPAEATLEDEAPKP